MKKQFLFKKVLASIVCLTFVFVLVGCNNTATGENGNKVFYDFDNDVTTSSPTDYKDVIKSSGSNVFAKLEGEQLSVCIYRNEKLACFKNNNYNEEIQRLQAEFGADNCSFGYRDKDDLVCADDIFSCYAFAHGGVHCYDTINTTTCNIVPENRDLCYKYTPAS